MQRPMSEEDTLADDLPPSIAVQYRILRKLLPGPSAKCHQAVSVMDPAVRRRAPARSTRRESTRRCSSTGPAKSSTASALSSLCLGNDHWSDDAKVKTLREIELGGPIFDQLLEMRATHGRIEAAFGDRWRDTWRTFAEFESMHRCLIETMAGWFFEAFSLLLFDGVFRQLGEQTQRATVAEKRVNELERNTEELWKYNGMLEDRHGQSLRMRQLEEDDMRRDNEEVRRTLEVCQEELCESRQVIAALGRKLREAEAASKAPLHALTEEFEKLKAQYRDLVDAHGHTPPTTGEEAEERGLADVGEDRASVVLLRRQVKELQHQLSLRDTDVGLLQQQLGELRELVREFGVSQAKVHTLEQRLKLAMGSHPQ
ncbi:hypothetical protein TraAM80_03747 [Trypanosoma rangeli]|uniref:Uncharacterized protein n=1 Tax=Trypanosoma rangeli TaxID=5698 RepID=A0A3R7KFD2_TRYRA|nr:uncharacterized protein TraAM80_03747 [Trypanosoma rangeli]RNF06724.1 hypothetical protein TraAM80_03747 [Trypanosoma rangeli]|eukprot:RNF06724.1 hypothetical protein TraAM80_03747 [Trypanosoma rangeli]